MTLVRPTAYPFGAGDRLRGVSVNQLSDQVARAMDGYGGSYTLSQDLTIGGLSNVEINAAALVVGSGTGAEFQAGINVSGGSSTFSSPVTLSGGASVTSIVTLAGEGRIAKKVTVLTNGSGVKDPNTADIFYMPDAVMSTNRAISFSTTDVVEGQEVEVVNNDNSFILTVSVSFPLRFASGQYFSSKFTFISGVWCLTNQSYVA